MVTADTQQVAQGEVGEGFVQLVECDDHRGVDEEVGRLFDLLRQLSGKLVRGEADQLDQRHRQHATLEVEYRVVVEQVEGGVSSHGQSSSQ